VPNLVYPNVFNVNSRDSMVFDSTKAFDPEAKSRGTENTPIQCTY
jgi:hypothetical protein